MKREILWEDQWLRVTKLNDWYTSYEQVKGDGICVIVLSPETKEVLVRMEHTPCHGEGLRHTSITGLCDVPGESPEETAVRELDEEANIITSADNLLTMGWVYPSKASNFKLHRYALSINKSIVPLTPPRGDSTEGEKGAYCIWVDYDEAFVMVKCPTFLSMLGEILFRTT